MLNPYQASTLEEQAPADGAAEERRRTAFVVSMWVCGVAAIALLPVYPWQPSYWATRELPNGVHYAWIAPFACSVASVLTGLGLLCLPRPMDKLGAILGILLVGWWPGWLAICWWGFFVST